MTKVKFFLDPINKLEPWLNSIAKQGYRLMDVLNFVYTFEKTDKVYSYTTQYLGSKSDKEVAEYTHFLKEGKYPLFYAPLNQGNIVFGKLKFRPYSKGSGKIATSFNRFNREILIVENLGEIPENLLTTNQDLLYYYQSVRSLFVYGFAVLTLLLGIVLYNVYEKGWSSWSIGSSAVLGLLVLFYIFLVLRNETKIRGLKSSLRE